MIGSVYARIRQLIYPCSFYLMFPYVKVNTEVMPQLDLDQEVEGKSKVTPYAILLDIKIKNLDVTIKRSGEVENPLTSVLGVSPKPKPNRVSQPVLESFTEDEEEEEEENDRNGDVESQMSSSASSMLHTEEKSHHKKKGRDSLISVKVQATSGIEAFEVAENVQPSEVVIICPLPTKDPLIEYRKMYDLMNALGGQKGVDIGGLKVSRRRKEQLLQHKNTYSWTDAIQGNIEVNVV